MRDEFLISEPHLSALEESVKAHKPFLIVNVGITGVDNVEYSDNMPMRVIVKEYQYSENSKCYEDVMTFDRAIKYEDNVLNEHLKNPNYDAFTANGIDKTEYESGGTSIVSSDKFCKEFNGLLASYSDSDIQVVSNDTEANIKYLEKIGCADAFKDFANQGNVLNLLKIAKEYTSRNGTGISPKNLTLSNLVRVMREKQKRPLSDSEKTLNGTDVQANIIAEFVSFYGREKGLLPSNEEVRFTEAGNTYIEDNSQRGREKYEKASVAEKIETLIKTNAISEQVKDRDYPCEINKLYNVLEGKGKNKAKGVIIMQCATTGFGADNMPIQFSAVVCSLQNGVPNVDKKFCIDIKADAKSVEKAKNNIVKKYRPFDAFKYCDIDLNEYENGISHNEKPLPKGVKTGKVYSQEEAVKQIEKFFSDYDTDKEWAIITNGTSKDGRKSFTQECLDKIGNMAINNSPFIDFTQALKEYVYKCQALDKEIAVFHNEWNEKGFSLDCFAHNLNLSVKNTTERCGIVFFLARDIAKQIVNDKILQTVKEASEQERKKVEEIKSIAGEEPEKMINSNARLAIPNASREAPMFNRYDKADDDEIKPFQPRRMRPRIPSIEDGNDVMDDIYSNLGYEREERDDPMSRMLRRDRENERERRRSSFSRAEFERHYERDYGGSYPDRRNNSDMLNSFVDAMSDVLSKQASMVSEQTRFISEQNIMLGKMIEQMSSQASEASRQNAQLIEMCQQQMSVILNMLDEKENVGRDKIAKIGEKTNINKEN